MKAPKIFVEVLKVTPAIAERYLEKNTNNRPPNPKRVTAYAKLMKEGKWTDNGVIEFGKDGTLFDGQTRLQAVVESGTSVWFTVKHGVSDESRANIDIGRARTAGNWLTMIGIPNGNRVAAANLGEFGAPERLALALLMEPARDSGLPFSESEKTIRDGLRHGGRTS